MTGKIIAFEGLPNAGKTVNVTLLKKDFPNFHYVPELATLLFEEKGVISGEKTTDEIALIFWDYELKRCEQACKDKSNGKIVVFDRNIFSCIAHTYASEQHHIHAEEKSIYFRNPLLHPDAYIYLVISPETSIARRGSRKFENMGPLDHIQRMEYAYNSYFGQHPQLTKLIRISGEPSIQNVYAEVKKAIELLLI